MQRTITVTSPQITDKKLHPSLKYQRLQRTKNEVWRRMTKFEIRDSKPELRFRNQGSVPMYPERVVAS
jgi:hypothetical protein